MNNPVYTLLNENQPFIFAKFGDGEHACASNKGGANCDGDSYNGRLAEGLKAAVVYYSALENAYLGAWHTGNVPVYFSGLVARKINWVDYHTFIMDNESFKSDVKLNIYKSIKENPRKKIIVANELLARSKILLNIDHHVVVPYRNWFEKHFDTIVNSVLDTIGDDNAPLVITCCGMGAKVLIMEVHKRKPNGIYIDVGSGLDYLCTKKCSRGNRYSYDVLEAYFGPILPAGWNDPSYEWIYEAAKRNIGIHLR